MSFYEILFIATPLVVAALGWFAVLIFEWNIRREDRAHEALQRTSPPAS